MSVLIFLCIVSICLFHHDADAAGLRPVGQPGTAVPTRTVPAVDAVILQAISDGTIPGAVLIVGHDGRVMYGRAYAAQALQPRRGDGTLAMRIEMAALT